ncbi:MAG: CPBP family intramembrane glutamic endopeptidase [Gemmatimonadaceae bacterium]
MLAAKQTVGDAPALGVSIVLQLLYCGLAGFVLWTVVRKERLPLASIGLRRPRWSTLLVAGLLWLVSLHLLPFLTVPLRDAAGTAVPAGLHRLASLPIWFRVVQALTGGVIEEILYRGYAIERLTTITGRPWFAGMVAAIGFGLAHVPSWGVRYALIADLPFGVVATLCYLWRRDLLANMLAHDFGLLLSVLSVSRLVAPAG